MGNRTSASRSSLPPDTAWQQAVEGRPRRQSAGGVPMHGFTRRSAASCRVVEASGRPRVEAGSQRSGPWRPDAFVHVERAVRAAPHPPPRVRVCGQEGRREPLVRARLDGREQVLHWHAVISCCPFLPSRTNGGSTHARLSADRPTASPPAAQVVGRARRSSQSSADRDRHPRPVIEDR